VCSSDLTKKAVTKKTTTKKTTKKSTTKKSTTKKVPVKGSPSSSKVRRYFGAGDAGVLKAGQDAAARLAAAAGLAPVVASSGFIAQKETKYRKLTKSPLSKKQLDEFREILIAKRRLIIGDVSSMEEEALTGGDSGALSNVPQHMADQGSDTFDQSLSLDLAASQRTLLKEIDDALDRITNNTYGICEQLGKPIKIDRLRQTPWARYSIEAAKQIEGAGYFPA